jgi:F-type H+-transporting ATPase subunit a
MCIEQWRAQMEGGSMAFSPTGPTLLEGEVPTFGLDAFNSRPLFPSEVWQASDGAQYVWTDIWITNHILMAVIGAALAIGLWLVLSHKPQVVPTKRQFLGEWLYNLIRNGVARDVIGDNFRAYLPWLLALCTFILFNNLFGVFFLTMFPTFSKIGFAWALAILSWVLYNWVGIRQHGFGHYLRMQTVPAGVKGPVLILVAPLEFLSNLIIRPVTLAVRLFANLFAGHLMVMIFVVGGTWLVNYANHHNLIYTLAGGLSLVFSFGIFALELLVAVLQAYIFTILTANYVASAEAAAH